MGDKGESKKSQKMGDVVYRRPLSTTLNTLLRTINLDLFVR